MHKKSFIPSIFNFLQLYLETNFFFCPFCLQGKKCLTDLFIQTIFCFFHWYVLIL